MGGFHKKQNHFFLGCSLFRVGNMETLSLMLPRVFRLWPPDTAEVVPNREGENHEKVSQIHCFCSGTHDDIRHFLWALC